MLKDPNYKTDLSFRSMDDDPFNNGSYKDENRGMYHGKINPTDEGEGIEDERDMQDDWDLQTGDFCD